METETGRKISSQAVILTCGTFLNGLIHIGLKSYSAGRAGEFPVKGLTECLVKLGFESGRLKLELHRGSTAGVLIFRGWKPRKEMTIQDHSHIEI